MEIRWKFEGKPVAWAALAPVKKGHDVHVGRVTSLRSGAYRADLFCTTRCPRTRSPGVSTPSKEFRKLADAQHWVETEVPALHATCMLGGHDARP